MFFSSLAWIFSPNYFQKKRERARKRKTYYSAAILWLFTLGEMPAYLNKFQIGDDSENWKKCLFPSNVCQFRSLKLLFKVLILEEGFQITPHRKWLLQ